MATLRLVNEVCLSQHAIKMAKRLNANQFPGAVPTLAQQPAKLSRIRKDELEQLLLANHLNNEEFFSVADAGVKNAEAGRQFLRHFTIRRSWMLFNIECAKLGLAPQRWETYWKILSSKLYVKATAQNCVCVYCRTLGSETFEELRELIGFIVLPAGVGESLLQRVKLLEQYLMVEYPARLKDEHACAYLCIKFGLTTQNFEGFCSHALDTAGTFLEQPTTVDDISLQQDGQYATVDAWDSECQHCNHVGKNFLCNNCAMVICKKCMQRTWDDVSANQDNGKNVAAGSPMCPTGYCCRLCQADVSSVNHNNTDDARILEINRLQSELNTIIDVCGIEEGHVADFPPEVFLFSC